MDFNKYIGIEYRDPDEDGNGLHCWELVELIMRDEFGLIPPQVEFSDNYKKAHGVFIGELEKWRKIPIGQQQAGDLVLIRIGQYYCHCGIMIGQRNMLHCLRGRGTTLDSPFSREWTNRLLGFYRWGN